MIVTSPRTRNAAFSPRQVPISRTVPGDGNIGRRELRAGRDVGGRHEGSFACCLLGAVMVLFKKHPCSVPAAQALQKRRDKKKEKKKRKAECAATASTGSQMGHVSGFRDCVMDREPCVKLVLAWQALKKIRELA